MRWGSSCEPVINFKIRFPVVKGLVLLSLVAAGRALPTPGRTPFLLLSFVFFGGGIQASCNHNKQTKRRSGITCDKVGAC